MEESLDMSSIDDDWFQLFTNVDSYDFPGGEDLSGITTTDPFEDATFTNSMINEAFLQDCTFNDLNADTSFADYDQEFPHLSTHVEAIRASLQDQNTLDLGPETPVIQTSTTSTSRIIRPKSSRALSFSHNPGISTSDESLAPEFEQALRAICRDNKTNPTDSRRKEESYQKFRVTLPNEGRIVKKNGLKNPRFKRSLGRPCLFCKFSKRGCSLGTPCERCVEKHLGQRDLAFTHCLRDKPCDFNPYFIEASSDEYLRLEEEFSPVRHVKFMYIKNVMTHRKINGPLVGWLFEEIRWVMGVGYNSTRAELVQESDNELCLRIIQSRLTHLAFECLEKKLNSSPGVDKVALHEDLVFIACYLYAFLEEMPLIRAETKEICRRYLTEYIMLTLPRCGSLRSFRVEPDGKVSSGGRKIQISDFIAIVVSTIIEYGPRTTLQICIEAYRTRHQLLENITGEISIPASALVSSSRCGPLVWRDWLCEFPRDDDPTEVISVWSLFWKSIPRFVRDVLDLSRMDFLGTLLRFGRGSCLMSLGGEFLRLSWLRWKEKACAFNQILVAAFSLTPKVKSIPGTDLEIILDIARCWRMDIPSFDTTPSQELRSLFRCLVTLLLQPMGLMKQENLQLFIGETFSAASGSNDNRFCEGWIPAIQICLGIAEGAEIWE